MQQKQPEQLPVQQSLQQSQSHTDRGDHGNRSELMLMMWLVSLLKLLLTQVQVVMR